jgi:aspartate kinase
LNKKRITILKFGGGAFGVDGNNLPSIIDKIKYFKKEDEVGPIVVVSAPKTLYNNKVRSLTDVAIDIGERYSDFYPIPSDPLFLPYIKIMDFYVSKQFKKAFQDELYSFREIVKRSLNQTMENRRFVDVNRARVLAYSGEIAMSCLVDYILRSEGLDCYHPSIDNWPIITDDDFENAKPILELSKPRIENLIDNLKVGRIICIGGFIGVTSDGLETTFERGGSDRTAVELAIMMHDKYQVNLNFQKEGMVLSADPSIVKSNLEPVIELSYNEAIHAARFGMKIIDTSAIRDLQESGLDIPMYISDLLDINKISKIVKEPKKIKNVVKLVTGKKGCAITEFDKDKRSSFEDYLKQVRRYQEFFELRPYQKGKVDYARFLFLDESYVKRNEKEIKSFSSNTRINYNLASITLVGDNMANQPGVAANAFNAIFQSGINIIDGDIQSPTSSILIIVENKDLDKAISAIHARKNDKYNQENKFQ